ncbi:MAG: aminotransferase class V-fold PLP-dependent enzyme, partial [Candidatus Promineifilaceae bacterium]|nr:aminotransferase class V-fold PLP-dependent enzyme [Candidatus Promineifilaceae bacterium]
MKTKVHNFNAGPSVLPKQVLQQAQSELLDYHGLGMSIMEMSHRSKPFDQLMESVQSNIRLLMGIPQNYKILFLQGGASLQFSMVPMNILAPNDSADYIVNGTWGQKALKEAKKVGSVRVAATTESFNFDRLPKSSELALDEDASYVHFTSNETIHGVQWVNEPQT